MDGSKMNISTVEDPVEYHLGFANQIQVHEKIGMTFAAGVRAALLRQDLGCDHAGRNPRQRNGAHCRAGGHDRPPGALDTAYQRCPQFGHAIDQHRRRTVFDCVPRRSSWKNADMLAQRRCDASAASAGVEALETGGLRTCREFLSTHGFDPDKIYKGKGCDRCRNTGYKGRVGIYELLVLDDVWRPGGAQSECDGIAADLQGCGMAQPARGRAQKVH